MDKNYSTNGLDHHRIVVTGGPGGGKTTAADLFRREIGECIVIVPETASMLFSGGFPRNKDPKAVQFAQRAIYHVQKNNEDIHACSYPKRTLLCDRGTIDGAAYWPGEPEDFFLAMDTSHEAELKRYDAVLFFETAAVGNISIEGGNPQRIEGLEEAKKIDQKLRKLWSPHPNFTFVPHDPSFMEKIIEGLSGLKQTLNQLQK